MLKYGRGLNREIAIAIRRREITEVFYSSRRENISVK